MPNRLYRKLSLTLKLPVLQADGRTKYVEFKLADINCLLGNIRLQAKYTLEDLEKLTKDPTYLPLQAEALSYFRAESDYDLTPAEDGMFFDNTTNPPTAVDKDHPKAQPTYLLKKGSEISNFAVFSSPSADTAFCLEIFREQIIKAVELYKKYGIKVSVNLNPVDALAILKGLIGDNDEAQQDLIADHENTSESPLPFCPVIPNVISYNSDSKTQVTIEITETFPLTSKQLCRLHDFLDEYININLSVDDVGDKKSLIILEAIRKASLLTEAKLSAGCVLALLITEKALLHTNTENETNRLYTLIRALADSAEYLRKNIPDTWGAIQDNFARPGFLMRDISELINVFGGDITNFGSIQQALLEVLQETYRLLIETESLVAEGDFSPVFWQIVSENCEAGNTLFKLIAAISLYHQDDPTVAPFLKMAQSILPPHNNAPEKTPKIQENSTISPFLQMAQGILGTQNKVFKRPNNLTDLIYYYYAPENQQKIEERAEQIKEKVGKVIAFQGYALQVPLPLEEYCERIEVQQLANLDMHTRIADEILTPNNAQAKDPTVAPFWEMAGEIGGYNR